MYYIYLDENNQIIAAGVVEMGNAQNIETTEEVYNNIEQFGNNYYMWNGSEVVINPNYEEEQAEKRRIKFHKEFFNTSLGYIRRSVTMADGSHKDFLSDLLPVISMAVSQMQPVTILAYTEPDFTQDVEDWTIYQHEETATPQFIQDCFNQLQSDFIGANGEN